MMAPPKRIGHVWTACAVALVGCAGGPAEPIGGAGEASSATASPLPVLGSEAWEEATPGCEGQLDGTEQFALTARDGLVVALRGGCTWCVDSLAAVELELERIGLGERAEALHDSALLSQYDFTPLASDTSPTGGEPNPEPNIEGAESPGSSVPRMETPVGLGPVEGEPNPEPNVPTGGEPNPEPNMPTGGEPNPEPNRPATSDGSPSDSPTGSTSMDEGSPPAGAIGGIAGATTS